MATHTLFLPLESVTAQYFPLFPIKKILIGGAVAAAAGFALSRYVQHTFKTPPSWVPKAYLFAKSLPLRQRQIVIGGAAILYALSPYLRIVLNSPYPRAFKFRLSEQLPYSVAAVVGIGVILGGEALISLFKIDISFHPFKISLVRHKTTGVPLVPPKEPSLPPAVLNTEEEQKEETQNGIPKNQEQHWSIVPEELWRKEIFLRILHSADDFTDFHAFASVCKAWKDLLYHQDCLVFFPKKKPCLSKAFARRGFDIAKIVQFFGIFCPKYRGQALYLSTKRLGCELGRSVTPDQLARIATQLPEATIDHLRLLLGESDDSQVAGKALSSLLKEGGVETLTISLRESQDPDFKALYSGKVKQLLSYMKGKIPELILEGGYGDLWEYKQCMKGLQIKKLRFIAEKWFPPVDSMEKYFGSLELEELFIENVQGKTLTEVVKMTPCLEKVYLLKTRGFEEREEDPLNDVSLEGLQLKEIKIVAERSEVQAGKLREVLKTQTCLQRLSVEVLDCGILPDTFEGLPIETLCLRLGSSCNENDLGKALSSIRATLKSLSIECVRMTGSCLQGLHLKTLRIHRVQGIKEDLFKQALLGRSLERLFLSDLQITGACLQGLQIEELSILGEFSKLDRQELDQALKTMKEQGLKKLSVNYRGKRGKDTVLNLSDLEE